MLHAKIWWYQALICDGCVTRKCYDSVYGGFRNWSQLTGNYDGFQLLYLEQMHRSILTEMLLCWDQVRSSLWDQMCRSLWDMMRRLLWELVRRSLRHLLRRSLWDLMRRSTSNFSVSSLKGTLSHFSVQDHRTLAFLPYIGDAIARLRARPSHFSVSSL